MLGCSSRVSVVCLFNNLISLFQYILPLDSLFLQFTKFLTVGCTKTDPACWTPLNNILRLQEVLGRTNWLLSFDMTQAA
jgi:hypothetical protein